MFEPRYEGSLPQTFVQVSHVFRKFPCSSHIDLPSARLQYFIEQVSIFFQTLIVIMLLNNAIIQMLSV